MSIIDQSRERGSFATSDQVPGAKQRAFPVVQSITLGLRLAIIGSTMLALVECLGATIFTARYFPDDRWPIDLIMAALGKAALTHTIIWCPLIIACAVGYWFLARKRTLTEPIPFLSAVYIGLIGLFVIPTDIELATETSRSVLIAASVGTLIVAAGSYFTLRAIFRKVGMWRVMMVINVATALSLLITLVSGIAFVRSPLLNLGTYRVPQVSKVKENPERPHVLLIVLDTVRADRMSCYGYDIPTTPFLESWVSRSITFDLAIANGVPTPPSHASMFTGLSVRSHGVIQGNNWLDDRLVTIAEVLSDHGYMTASFSNNPWVSPSTNLTHGFDHVWMIWYLRHLSRFSLEYVFQKWGITPMLPWLDPDFGAGMTNYLIDQWLDTYASGTAPLFLFVNYMEAHLPYRVPRQYRRLFMTDQQVDRSYDLRQRVYGDIVNALDQRFNKEGGDFLEMPDREVLKRQYEAGIRYLDDRVRELIDMFEQRGLRQNTLVIVTSDHGEYLDTHGMWGHRFLLYNDLAHVPLLVRAPGNHQPARISTPVQLSDIYPTILNAALESTARTSGTESRDLVKRAAQGGQPRIVISEGGVYSSEAREKVRKLDDPRLSHRVEPQITAQDGRFKYIASDDGMRELYNLLVDPGEQNNLIESYPAETERLAAYIQEWLDAVPQYQSSRPDATAEMDPKLEEALRTLGYVGN